ncbi:MAG: hypothetical protein WBB34_12430 [Xanthobacteraceae bacterium]
MSSVHRYRQPDAGIINKKLEWLREALEARAPNADAYPQRMPTPELLIAGLREHDNPRWEIGIIHCEVERDPDGSSAINFHYAKPGDRRTEEERNWTQRLYDPAAVLVQQLHILFGGQLGMKTSRSHSKGTPFHYPAIYLPEGLSEGVRRFRFARGIVDAPPHRLATGNDRFRDLRRRQLTQPWLTQGKASERYGRQQGGKYSTRAGAIDASLSAFDANLKKSGLRLERDQYKRMLTDAYALLDRHPLQRVTKADEVGK